MKKILVLTLPLMLMGCFQSVEKIGVDQLSTKGAVLGGTTINGGICIGSLAVQKISSKSPLIVQGERNFLRTFGSLNIGKALSGKAVEANVTYLDAGEYAITHFYCQNGDGRTTYTYNHTNPTGALAFFHVNKGEILNIGSLNLTTESTNFLIFSRFKRFSKREAYPINPGVIEKFEEVNPTLKGKIINRFMVTVTIPPLPPEPEKQPE